MARIPDERGGWLRWLLVPRRGVGAAAAGLAVAAIAVAAGVGVLARPPSVAVSSPVAGMASVSPAASVVVHFSSPMDHAAVQSALSVAPAAAVRSTWRGDDLVVTPVRGLAPDAAYVLTIGRAATTAGGARLGADLHVVFGTAPAAVAPAAPRAPASLPLRFVAAADAGSEAVITTSGDVIATSATAVGLGGITSGDLALAPTHALLRVRPNGAVDGLGPGTSAICLSRSGQSLAYAVAAGGAITNPANVTTGIRMTGPDGAGGVTVPVHVDAGSPLGWIDDREVSFVGGGRLRAVDRDGRVRVLSRLPVDAARDTVVISPGGRYVFLRSAKDAGTAGRGSLLDLTAGTSHALAGVTGEPAFSADGGTVVWQAGTALAEAPSAGGPVLTVPLPLEPGDQVSDLAVSPDGARFVYSVRHEAGGAELRLAALADGASLAVSASGTGASPSWDAAGSRFAVLGASDAGPAILVADLPAQADAEALAAAFADAQVDRDAGAMAALADPGVAVDGLPAASRSSVLQVRRAGSGAVQVNLRLVLDPTPGHPVARTAIETLDLGQGGGPGRLAVAGVRATPLTDVAPGPHVVRVASGPGGVAVTFDSDLDPSSLAGAFGLTRSDGTSLPVALDYEPDSRTATLTLPAGTSGALALAVGTGVRDVGGARLAMPVRTQMVI